MGLDLKSAKKVIKSLYFNLNVSVFSYLCVHYLHEIFEGLNGQAII